MKLRTLALGAFAATLLASCGGEKKEATENTTETTATTEVKGEKASYGVDTEASKVMWEGHTTGIKAYGHEGTIDITDGTIEMTGDMITGGNFEVDMTTIDPTDDGYNEEHPEEQLVGHLSTGDFFLVDSFPTATFKIKSSMGDKIVGDLTVRGNTHEETVEDVKIETMDGGVKATGKLVFDRQKYDVSWAHYLKDVVLADDITLDLEIVAKK